MIVWLAQGENSVAQRKRWERRPLNRREYWCVWVISGRKQRSSGPRKGNNSTARRPDTHRLCGANNGKYSAGNETRWRCELTVQTTVYTIYKCLWFLLRIKNCSFRLFPSRRNLNNFFYKYLRQFVVYVIVCNIYMCTKNYTRGLQLHAIYEANNYSIIQVYHLTEKKLK